MQRQRQHEGRNDRWKFHAPNVAQKFSRPAPSREQLPPGHVESHWFRNDTNRHKETFVGKWLAPRFETGSRGDKKTRFLDGSRKRAGTKAARGRRGEFDQTRCISSDREG
jgi:hypothetical protein